MGALIGFAGYRYWLIDGLQDVKTGLDEADHGEVFYEYVLLLIYSVLGIRFGLKHVIMPLLTKE